jgi:hypothetical protein
MEKNEEYSRSSVKLSYQPFLNYSEKKVAESLTRYKTFFYWFFVFDSMNLSYALEIAQTPVNQQGFSRKPNRS